MSSVSYFAHATAFFVALAIVLTIRVRLHRARADALTDQTKRNRQRTAEPHRLTLGDLTAVGSGDDFAFHNKDIRS